MSAIKIFKVSEVDWYAAETLEAAIAKHNADYGTDAPDTSDAYEADEEMMGRLLFHRDDGTNVTFREELAHELAHPDEYKFPAMFASTEY